MNPQIIQPGGHSEEPAADNSNMVGSTPPTPAVNPVPLNNPSSTPPISQPSSLPPTSAPLQPIFQPEASMAPADKPNLLKRLFKRPSKLATALILVLLIGVGAAYYFVLFLPNQPDHIWRMSLQNTGKGYDKLSQYATQKKYQKSAKFSGSFKLSGSFAADGTFSGGDEGSNSQFLATLSAVGLKTNIDIRTIGSANSTPDIYFKVDGVQGLGNLLGGADPTIVKDLNGINGNWYFIDHSLFDELDKGANTTTQISSDDINSILQAVGDAGKQNIFTSDPSKMAFVVKKNIGKEVQDNRKVYHYQAGINKANLKSYATTLCNNLKNSKLNKFFNNDPEQTATSIGCNNWSQTVDKWDDTKTADVWVDLHTKLIHKVRFASATSKDSYFDIGQDYQGGDSFPFLLDFSDKSNGTTSTGNLSLTINTTTNVFGLKGNFNSDGEQVHLDLNVTPSNDEFKVDKPTGSKNIIELFNDIGLGQDFSTSPIDSSSDQGAQPILSN